MPSILLLLTISTNLWLNVPFVKQAKNGCGSASLRMILQYWKLPDVPAVEAIQHELYSPEAAGIHASDMQLYLQRYGLHVYAFSGAWDDLVQQLSKGRPLIVCLEMGPHGVPLHYVVVAGIDDTQGIVFVNDPARRKLLALDRKEFERAWNAMNRWILLAFPDSESANQQEPEEPPVAATPAASLPLEQASAAFREHRLGDAKHYLQTYLQKTPADAYANNFIATVFLLEGNSEAALKYWNRTAMPVLRNVIFDPPLKTNPVLLDRSLAFARGDMISLEAYRTTLKRLDNAGVFPRYELELAPTEAREFDLKVHAWENNGFGVLSMLRGIPSETIYPEWSNGRARTTNVGSLLRWDREKRRADLSVSAPLSQDISRRYNVNFDYRDENWLHDGNAFNMRRTELTIQFQSTESDRWGWTSGASFSDRRFTNAFTGGAALKYVGTLQRRVVDVPERRMRIDATAGVQVARLFDVPQRFAKVDGKVEFRWLPRPKGDDYETRVSARAGQAFGTLPFDEQFSLGLDRDGDLWLRGHPATIDGRKGAALMGREFFLVNSDVSKIVYRNGYLGISLGPLLDVAHVASNRNWFVDGGLQLRVSVLKVASFSFSVAQNVRSGQWTSFANSTR